MDLNAIRSKLNSLQQQNNKGGGSDRSLFWKPSIGKQTIIENVMVSYCQGNSFSVYGGDVMLNRLVSYKSSFNDYRFNYGAQVHIKNSLAIKSPYVSGAQSSKAMYVYEL